MSITLNGTTGLAGTNGSAGTPAVQGEDTNTGIFFPAADTVAVATGGTERMRVDSSGNVGIGNSNPTARLEVVTSSGTAAAKIWSATNTTPIADLELQRGTNATWGADAYGDYRLRNDAGALLFQYGESSTTTERMRIDSSGNVGIGTDNPIAKLTVLMDTASLSFGNLSTNVAQIGVSSVSDIIAFGQFVSGGATFDEKARIDSSGNLLVGGTSANPATAGGNPAQSALAANGQILAAVTSDAVMELNRTSTDGTLVNFRQAATVEGSISVSGTTVSYNGGHLSRWAQFPDNSRPELLKGTVMSNLDQMSNWDGEDNEQLNCVQVSAVEGDANVAGVFVAWDSTDDGYNDILLAMTGDMVIRIGAGVTVARGDLLMSAGDGTAKPQGDDIVRSKTIAKVTSTHVSHTYADGSYAVPCVLMAC